MSIIIITLLVVIVVAILSIPIALAYRFYSHQKQKNESHQLFGLLTLIITTVFIISFLILFFFEGFGFGTEYDTVEIPQKIGGKLICKSIYNSDLHSWQYNVNYKYINHNNDTLDFTSGGFYGRDWKMDEQIKEYKDWLLLSTGAWHGMDRLIIKNKLTHKSYVYDFNKNFIENDSLWKTQNLKSYSDGKFSEVYIESVHENRITLNYTIRKDTNEVTQYVRRKIIYELDHNNGAIRITSIQ